MCGGRGNLHCYRYVPANDTWVVSGTLSYSHFGNIDKMRIGFTYHDVLGLVVAGASWSENGTTKVESTVDGEMFQELRDLPANVLPGPGDWGQCLVTLENGNLFQNGGYRKKSSLRYKPPPDDRWDDLGRQSWTKSDLNSRGCGKGPLTYEVRNGQNKISLPAKVTTTVVVTSLVLNLATCHLCGASVDRFVLPPSSFPQLPQD